VSKEDFIALKKKLDWSNIQAAEKLSKTEQSISNYIHGRQAIPADVEKLMNFYLEESNDR